MAKETNTTELLASLSDGPTTSTIFLSIIVKPFVIVTASASLFTIVVSCLTMIAIFNDITLRKKADTPFLLSLMVSDTVIAAVWSSYAVIVMVNRGQWPGHPVWSRVMVLSRYFFFTSNMSTALISVNRFLLLTRPYPSYLRMQSRRIVLGLVASTWLVTFISQLENFLVNDYSPSKCTLGSDGPSPSLEELIKISIIYNIPIVTLVTANVIIVCRLRKIIKRVAPVRIGRGNRDFTTTACSDARHTEVTSIGKHHQYADEPTGYVSDLPPLNEVPTNLQPTATTVFRKVLTMPTLLPSVSSGLVGESQEVRGRGSFGIPSKVSPFILCFSLVAVAVVFTLPLSIYLNVTYWFPELHYLPVWGCIFSLTFLNPAANSLVYVFTNRRIRLFYAKIFRKYFRRASHF